MSVALELSQPTCAQAMQEPAAPSAAGAAEPLTSPVDDDQARRSWPSALCRCVAPSAAAPLLLAPARSVLAGARGSAGACERERESQARACGTLTPTTPVPTRAQVEVRAGKPSTGSSLSCGHEATGEGVDGFSRADLLYHLGDCGDRLASVLKRPPGSFL